MKDFRITLSVLAIALVMSSCGESQKNQTSGLEEKAMLEEANIKIVRSFYEFMDKQDSTSLEKLIGKEFALFFGSSEEPVNYSQIKPLNNEVYFAFPDYKHEIEIIFASGQYVTSKLKYSGTHTNSYMGITPTEKKVSYKGIFIFRLKDGMITEVHGMEDDLAALIKAK